MLNVKLSLLSKTAVEYLPLSIVISTSKYDSAVVGTCKLHVSGHFPCEQC